MLLIVDQVSVPRRASPKYVRRAAVSVRRCSPSETCLNQCAAVPTSLSAGWGQRRAKRKNSGLFREDEKLTTT